MVSSDFLKGLQVEARINYLTPSGPGKTVVGTADGIEEVDFAAKADASAVTAVDTRVGRVDPGSAGTAGQLLTIGASGPAWLDSEIVNVRHPRFGVPASGDATSALQAILTANPGRTIVFPPGTYSFTTLTVAGDNTHLVLMAGAVLTKTTAATNGIVLAGAGCSVSGPGKIVSPASWDGTNTDWTYAVIYATGESPTIRGVMLENVPKVGIGLREVNNAQVLDNRITGNYPAASYTGTQTGHFAITLDGSPTAPQGNLVIAGNVIRSCVQGVILGNFSLGAEYGVSVTGNAFEMCWDHGVYISSGAIGSVIAGNTFLRCRIPVAVTGTDHIVADNSMVTDGTGALNDVTGISVRDAQRCIVRGNVIRGDGLADGTVISVQALSAAALTDNLIEGNVISVGTGTSTAIQVGAGASATEVIGNVVRGNIVRAKGRQFNGSITLTAPAAVRGKYNHVTDNTIVVTNDTYGIYVGVQDHAIVTGNTIRWEWDSGSAITTYGIYVVDSLDCAITRNRQVVTAAWGANINLRGYQDVGTSDYNLVADNDFLYDLTKLASGTPIWSTAANSIRRHNRTARAWPSYEAGTGAPTETRPNGSTYTRTDGAAGSTLYVREAGVWVAK